jgi:hypothetical protein
LEARKIGLLVVIFAGVIALQWRRLHFGVDFTDESYYAALSMRFWNHVRLFVDEVAPTQSFALVTGPLVGLHYSIARSHEGLILFMRCMYLIFATAIAVVTWLLIRRFVDDVSAFVIALGCLVFSPMYLSTLTYDTLGWGWYFLGVLLLFDSGDGTPGMERLFCIGGAFGLAAICYPTLILAEVLTLGSSVWPSARMSWHLSLVPTAVLLMVGLTGLLVATHGDPNLVLGVLRHARSMGTQAAGPGRLAIAFLHWGRALGRSGLVLLAFGAAGALGFRARQLFGWFLGALPFILLIYTEVPIYFSLDYLTRYALMGCLPFIYLRRDPEARRILLSLWLPGLIAGGTVAWTSSNETIMAPVGAFPAVVATSMLIVKALSAIDSSLMSKTIGIWRLPWLSAASVQIILLWSYWSPASVYRDAPLPDETSRVTHGAFKGLHTSALKADFIDRVAADLSHSGRPGEKLIVYDGFPAGYLLSDMVPWTNQTWIHPLVRHSQQDRESILDYFRDRGSQPDVALRMLASLQPDLSQLPEIHSREDPLDALVLGPSYRLLLRRPEYEIYRHVQ